MRVPLGNFGNVVAQPAPQVDSSAAYDAGRRLGATGMQIADDAQDRRTALARIKAGNAHLEHQIAVNSQAAAMADRIASGEVPYEQARKTFDEEIGKLKQPAIDYLDPVGAEGLDRGLKQNAAQGGAVVDRLVHAARRQDFQGQFASGLDNLGKLAGQPGADVAAINAQADQFAPFAQAGGIPRDQVAATLQNWKDRNWLNHATQRAMTARNDVNALQGLEHDLVAADGFYAGKLDTDKRNAVLRSVQADRDRIANLLEHQAVRRDARAERVLGAIDRQIASGVPATSEMWAGWETEVKGTPAAAEFGQLLDEEAQVQRVLRSPVPDQVAYVQAEEQKLLGGGGSVRDAANLARLKNAVTRNVAQLQEAPLLFNANRTGSDIQPIDLSTMLEEGGTERIASTMKDRAITLGAMRKQYGEQVQMRLLLPQEAQALSSMLAKASPQQAAQVFATLYEASGAPDVYRGAMQQIAPDAPVTALAGLLAAKDVDITLERNLFRADVTAPAAVVAATMLEGERLLNPSKSAKGEDGKPATKLYLPESKTLQQEFTNQVGSAFAGRPGAAENAFQAVQAYYVGKAAQSGRLAAQSADIDTDIVEEAITSTLGGVVDYNGNGQVMAPWGMDRSTFEDRVQQSFALELKRRGMQDSLAALLPNLGLRNNGDGTYYVVQGRSFLTDPKGAPIVISVADQAPR